MKSPAVFREGMDVFFLSFGLITILPQPLFALFGCSMLAAASTIGVGLIITLAIGAVIGVGLGVYSGCKYYQSEEKKYQLKRPLGERKASVVKRKRALVSISGHQATLFTGRLHSGGEDSRSGRPSDAVFMGAYFSAT